MRPDGTLHRGEVPKYIIGGLSRGAWHGESVPQFPELSFRPRKLDVVCQPATQVLRHGFAFVTAGEKLRERNVVAFGVIKFAGRAVPVVAREQIDERDEANLAKEALDEEGNSTHLVVDH